jgi:uncharacterized protein (TIGR04222 family)
MNLNPFDLRGPEFLFFYLCLCIVVIAVAAALRRRAEDYPISIAQEHELAADPYLLALLSGGQSYLVSVTTLSLLDRGLLEAQESGNLQTRDGQHTIQLARRPIEQAILQRCAQACPIARLHTDPNVHLVSERMDEDLSRTHLLPDATDRAQRRTLLTLGLCCLQGVALAKILVAINRGHWNIGFLILLTAIASVLLARTLAPPRTVAGDWVLKRVQELLAPLRKRGRANLIAHGGETNEVALLAAAFGFAALPVSMQHRLRPVHFGGADSAIGTSFDGGGGSSDGDSGGDSGGGGGGSSCGGGGGCGGCG